MKTSVCKYAPGIFVDFKVAINYFCWARVSDKLCEIGCGELAYTSHRRGCDVGTNEIVWKNLTCGCPQLSSCGPFNWNLMMATSADIGAII